MAKLRLGPVLDDKPIKRTVNLSAALDSDLAAYAEAYASEFGERLPVEKLIPPMLERFIRADRGFSKVRREPLQSPASETALRDRPGKHPV
jgi:hypothetical protein